MLAMRTKKQSPARLEGQDIHIHHCIITVILSIYYLHSDEWERRRKRRNIQLRICEARQEELTGFDQLNVFFRIVHQSDGGTNLIAQV